MATLSEIQAKGTPADMQAWSLAAADKRRDLQNAIREASQGSTSLADAVAATQGIALPDIGAKAYGLGGLGNGGEPQDRAGALELLMRVRQFDPNASIRQIEDNGGGGEGGSGGGMQQFVVDYDRSKLPKPTVEATRTNSANWGTAGQEHTLGPEYQRWDPNYGAMVDNRAIKQTNQSTDLDIWGPAIMAIITMGAGALAGGALGAGAQAGFGAGELGANATGVGLAQAGQGAARAAGSGDYVGAAASVLGAGLGAGGYGDLGRAVSAAPGVVNAARRGDWTSAALAAASPAARAAGIDPMLTSGATTFARILAAQQNSGRGGGR